MLFDRFATESVLRLAGVVSTFLLGVLIYLIYGYVWSALLLTGIAALQLYELIRFQQMISVELDRFISELEVGAHSGGTQQFVLRKYFPELEASLSTINDQFRERELKRIAEVQYLESVINFTPVPTLIADESGTVIYTSQPFRKLFSPNQIRTLTQLDSLVKPPLSGNDLQNRTEVSVAAFGTTRRYLVDRSDIVVRGERRHSFVFLDVEQALNSSEQTAWNRLIRVLTHEMMNSLTPISSLAEAAYDRASQSGVFDDDTKDALKTVSRRSRTLMNFVRSYHQLLKLPEPRKQPFQVAELLSGVANLFQEEVAALSIRCRVQSGFGDVGLIEQALINLVRNSLDALGEDADGKICINAMLNREGRLQFDVTDNGRGMTPEILQNALVPFYTSKTHGTGIGLSLSRQIALAHEGNLTIESVAQEGTKVTMTV